MPLTSPDFRLYHGNNLDVLAALLAAELAKPVIGGHLLDPDTILIPQPAMRRWLQKTLAQSHGIAANLRFLTPGEFVRDTLNANLAEPLSPSLDAGALRWRLFATLSDAAILKHSALQVLQHYLEPEQSALKAWMLAGELAGAFEKYQAWRGDWLLAWDAGGDPHDWQAELWRRASRGQRHRAQSLHDYLTRFGQDHSPAPRGLPARVFSFACLNVSPNVLRVIASTAKAGALHFFLPSPSRKYWGDLRSARERIRDLGPMAFDGEENPLLAANGRAGRDFIATLFSYDVVLPSGEIEAYCSPDINNGLLARLQYDLLERRAPPPASTENLPSFASNDRSLQVHACCTRLREVQVLHEQLRALLEADATLEPRDIAVMAPDIDAYAPHFQAVFGGALGSNRSIPYALADSGALAGAPLADLFIRLLELPLSRLTANEVLEFLAVPAVAQRFNLDAAAIEKLGEWILASGARWGLNAAHRARLGAPFEHAYTWAFALERLLLGYASGADHSIAGVAPWPELEGDAVLALDALLRLLRVLARLEETISQAQTAPRWCELLHAALVELLPETLPSREQQHILERLRIELDSFANDTHTANLETAIAPEVVRAYFRARLAEADARQPFLTGGITVCRMVPMRLIPFKVICLLGMNDGEFPRSDSANAINRLNEALADPKKRLTGDRSIRDDDRFLFLQLLSAAGSVFYLSYLGFDARDGQRREPSVLISELLDVAKHYFSNPDHARQTLTLIHPLQPFSLRRQNDPRDAHFDPTWRPLHEATGQERQSMPVFAPAAITHTAEPTLPIEVELEALCRFWINPQKAFLQKLGLRIDDKSALLPDNEPFATNPLRQYKLRKRVLAVMQTQGGRFDFAALRACLGAEGRLPPGMAGDLQLRVVIDEVKPFAKALTAFTSGQDEAENFSLDLGRYRLHGQLGKRQPPGFIRVQLGELKGSHHVKHGLDALVLAALDHALPLWEFAKFSADEFGPRHRLSLPPAPARIALAELLDAREFGLRQPLPFRPNSAWAFVDAQRRQTNLSSAWKKAEDLWQAHNNNGEGSDAWTALALRGRDPFSEDGNEAAMEFQTLAESVFAALSPNMTESRHDP